MNEARSANRPFKLSSLRLRNAGLDGAGARVERGETVTILRTPVMSNSSLAEVRTRRGDTGVVSLGWLDALPASIEDADGDRLNLCPGGCGTYVDDLNIDPRCANCQR